MKKTHFILLTLATFGCAEKMDSADVRTSGLRAEFNVTSNLGASDEPTRALGILYGGSDPIRLTGSDVLEVTEVGGDTKTMTPAPNADDYVATFDTQAEDTEFVFSLNRGPDDTDAPDSRVTLPPPFTVEGMENNGQVQEENGQVRVSRTSDVVLTWAEDHTDDDVNYRVIGIDSCLLPDSGSAGKNNGSITIPASAFDTMSDDADEVCGASLYVELERAGTRDAAYKSGTVRGRQRFWIQFVSTP